MIDETRIMERIEQRTATVARWAVTCLVWDTKLSGGIIELYAHYESYCRSERLAPLPRKVWIAAMKLAGFETQSGAFAGLSLEPDRVVQPDVDKC
jgi:hypothetical protein